MGIALAGRVDDDGHEERLALGHEVRAVLGQFPFEAEVAFEPRLGVGGDDGHEERAVGDLPADFAIPRVATAQLALVEPHLDV